jgi:hypothetical protein
MDTTRFAHVENEYFRLKGLLATGRMSQSDFEAALKQLVTHDEQGRYWMLGVDDAQWYMHNGKSWVRADPPGGAQSAQPRQASGVPMFALGGGIALLCLCGILGIFLAINQGLVKIGPPGSPTRFIIPTPFVLPTVVVAPSSTNPPAPTATALATATPTLTPTLTPTITSTPTATLTPTPTATPTLTPRPQGNCADPNARWENVINGQTIDPYASFLGTATADDFAGYVVEWQRPGSVLHRSTTPVVHGVIFVWNTYTVPNGVYPVALTVVLKDGSTLASCVVTVRVAH